MPTPSSSEGSAIPTSREECSGNAVSIGNGSSANLTFDASSGPSVLLNRGALATPVVLVSGVYVVSAIVAPQDAMTVGGGYYANLKLDAHGFSARTWRTITVVTAFDQSPMTTLGGTWYMPAVAAGDGGIELSVSNIDGVQAISFKLNDFFIQRVN